MSSYFDEHDCTPLADGTAPDELLQFARFEKAINRKWEKRKGEDEDEKIVEKKVQNKMREYIPGEVK